MRWFKVIAIALGVLAAFLIISSVVGFLVEAVIAALVVGAIVLAVKGASNRRRQISLNARNKKIPGPRYGGQQRRHNVTDVDDDLARLKRETGGQP